MRLRRWAGGGTITVAVACLLISCNGSDSTGPSGEVTIADLQVRLLQRPLDDRPVPIEVTVTVSDPPRVIGGEGRLLRLEASRDTCQAPGQSPVVATAPITAANVDGTRLRLVLQPRLPAGHSRLCFFVALPGLAQRPQGRRVTETPLGRTNLLDVPVDVFPAHAATSADTVRDPLVRISKTSPRQGREGDLPCPAGGVPTNSPCPVNCPGTFDGTIFQITISRTGSTAAHLDVHFGLSGTATTGFDYYIRPLAGTPASRILTIPAGKLAAKVCVITVAGTSSERDETVVVTLQPDPAYTMGSPSSTTVTILDFD
jgi:hypothetical protein